MKDRRILRDFAKVISIAISSAGNVKKEAEGRIKEKLIEGLSNLDLIQREEFTVFQEMLVKMKSDNEDLEKRLKLLEKNLSSKSKKKSTRLKPPKSSAKIGDKK
tara:strand:- start:362 stop:673 length:312 start_codon:yes stop_codon:yes gene_type:complete